MRVNTVAIAATVGRRVHAAPYAAPVTAAGETDRLLTVPNLFTLARLLCLPLFLYLLFGRDNRAAAALLLGGLGATDWVDGYLARRLGQVSEFGKKFDPTVDRLLFIVATIAIIIDEAAPVWFCVLVVIRELLVGGTIAIATVAFNMQRFDVSWWGKVATCLLMFAIPSFMLGASDIPAHEFFTVCGWLLGLPGLAISWGTAIAYVPKVRAGILAGRAVATPT
jgi:cardiolipin synthase (CMP-forming)